MKRRIYYLLFILGCWSCTFQDSQQILTYTVSKSDFEDILQIEGVVEPVRSATVVCPGNIQGTIAFLVEDGTRVEAGEVVCIIESPGLQTEYDDLLTRLENAQLDMVKTEVDVNMQYALLEAQVKTNEAETKIAQLDSLQLQYLSASQRKVRELELERAGIERERYQKKLKTLKAVSQSEIHKHELNIRQLSNRVRSIKEQIDKLELKAPQNGLALVSVNVLTGSGKLQVGDPVWGNMPIVNIPELSQMKVLISALERDYKAIGISDSVYYTFDAMPDNSAGGKILKKAPVGQPIARNSKVKVFEIEASMDTVVIVPDPGLTVNCHVVLKQVRDTIVVPQVAVFDEDSMKVVYVKHGKSFEAYQVTTGISSPKATVIASGLRGGEEIALSKPSSFTPPKKPSLPDAIQSDADTITPDNNLMQ